jgi:hypothetical protein
MKPSESLHQPLRTPPHFNPSLPFPRLQAYAAAASVVAFTAELMIKVEDVPLQGKKDAPEEKQKFKLSCANAFSSCH